jgi:hypothetical protein
MNSDIFWILNISGNIVVVLLGWGGILSCIYKLCSNKYLVSFRESHLSQLQIVTTVVIMQPIQMLLVAQEVVVASPPIQASHP